MTKTTLNDAQTSCLQLGVVRSTDGPNPEHNEPSQRADMAVQRVNLFSTEVKPTPESGVQN